LVAARSERFEVGADDLAFVRSFSQRVLGEDLVLVADDQLVFGLSNPNF
jgi:hypothetical protein